MERGQGGGGRGGAAALPPASARADVREGLLRLGLRPHEPARHLRLARGGQRDRAGGAALRRVPSWSIEPSRPPFSMARKWPPPCTCPALGLGHDAPADALVGVELHLLLEAFMEPFTFFTTWPRVCSHSVMEPMRLRNTSKSSPICCIPAIWYAT